MVHMMCFGQMHPPFSLVQPFSYSYPNFSLPTSLSGFVLFPHHPLSAISAAHICSGEELLRVQIPESN